MLYIRQKNISLLVGMSAIGVASQINNSRALWLSSIGNDVIHSTIQVQELDASVGRFSTLQVSDNASISTLNVSTLSLETSDVSGMYVSSIAGNTAFFSTLFLASGDGVNPSLRFTTDPSGVQVDGCAIRFDNLVYLTSTINIIQVSTLVDTDIFAQNGYFSTLSTTQTFGANQSFISSLQGGNGTFSSLAVSSLAATDISGDFARNWSQYPTQNSSIIFQPAYVLSNINNTLWFAGRELTDASGGGEDWSLFPAQSTVQMANQSMRGLSTLFFQDNASLTSLTGNNLFYNGQPIQFGAASNVSQWANFNAVTNVNMNNNSLNNVNGTSTTNLSVLSNFYNNDYTWLNTLEVGGTTLTPLMAVTSGGDVVCRNLQVGDNVTSLADVEIYGATALPGDSALYVEGGVQFDGGTIHGFSAGVLPVAGLNTGRIDVLQAGFNLLHPLVGAITTGAALSITAGGALSIAGGGYVEMNTSTLQMINTSQGNKNTTIQAGFLTVDPDVAPTSSIKLFNTLGGGVEIDGGGQGSLIGFSTVQASNLSSINLDVSTINGVDWQDISGGVFTTVSSFVNAQISTLRVSSLKGFANPATFLGSTIQIENSLQFAGANSYISSLRSINNSRQDTQIFFSTLDLGYQAGINPLGYVRVGGGGAFDSYFTEYTNLGTGLSTMMLQAKSSIVQNLTVSSLNNVGGLAVKVGSVLQFISPDAVDNVSAINLNPSAIPALNIGASTINLNTSNTFTQSLSTNRFSTSALQFSTGLSFSSNAAFSYPLFIEKDTANNLSTGGVAIAVQQHNFALGAVRNQIEMGARGNGENYIMSLWPGQNLEDLFIDATEVIVRDSDGFSTIMNLNPYGLITNGAISAPSVFVSSINATNAIPSYGQFLTLSTMNLIQNSTTLLHFSTAATSSNLTMGAYDITFLQNGVYKVGCSFQFDNTSGNDEVEYFFQKNNSVINYSGTKHTVQNNTESTAFTEIIQSFNQNDTLQVGLYTASTDVRVSTIQGDVTICPGAITTVYRVDCV